MNEQKVNMKLVGEVEKRPVLYNFTLPGYSRKDETEAAWSEVAKIVQMTGAECKDRWKNLRAVFVRNLKPPKSGAGAKQKKTYYLLEAMKFTIPYIKALGSPSGNLPIPPENEKPDQFEDLQDETALSQQVTPSLPPSPPPIPTQNTEMSQQSENVTQKQCETSTFRTPKRKRASKNEEIDKAFLDYFQAKKKPLSSCVKQNSKEEALKMFLLSMLPDLLTMTDEELRQFKRKALHAIDDIFTSRSLTSHQVGWSSGTTTPSTHSEMQLNMIDETDGTSQYSTVDFGEGTSGVARSERMTEGTEDFYEVVREALNQH